MGAILTILLAMLLIDALVLAAFPETVKKAVESLSPAEIRLAGLLELLLALGAAALALRAGL